MEWSHAANVVVMNDTTVTKLMVTEVVEIKILSCEDQQLDSPSAQQW